MFPYDDPLIRWVLATQLARSLHDCQPVDLDQLRDAGHACGQEAPEL
jgi:hypothetical protein